jgi:hypothetical protein
MMLIEILRHTPAWAFGLFALLVAIGLAQLRDRQLPLARLFVLPGVLLALGASNTWAAIDALPWAGPAWLLGLCAAGALALKLPLRAGVRWLPEQQRVLLPGSVAPLVLIMAVFGLRYGVTVAQVLHPALRTAAWLVLPLATFFGSLAGFAFGRAWALRSRLAPRAASPQAPLAVR